MPEFQEPWPPERCTTTKDPLDFGDQPAGEYTFTYMRGATQSGSTNALMPQGPMIIEFIWSGDAAISTSCQFKEESNGYRCFYNCPHQYIYWFGLPNQTSWSYDGYAVYLYEAWAAKKWKGSAQIPLAAGLAAGTGVQEGIISVTWNGVTKVKHLSTPGSWKGCPPSSRQGSVTVHEGGWFDW